MLSYSQFGRAKPALIMNASGRRCCVSADVVAWMQALSPGHRRRRSSAKVWGVCEKPPLPRGRRRRTGTDVVAREHALSPGSMHCCPRACIAARAQTSSPERIRFRLGANGCGRPTTPARDCRRCRPCRSRLCLNFTGYKRPSLPFSLHFASIRSFLAWTCLPAAPCENLTDRTLAFLSYCVLVYVNRIGVPSITFIFLIRSVYITCLASCKNGEAEEGDKGMGAMVYVATGWTYSEMCVLWKHNAV